MLGGAAGAAIGGIVVWLWQGRRNARSELAVFRERNTGQDHAGSTPNGHMGGDPMGDPVQQDLQRSALLRSVTHDLRTPLAAIRAIVSDLYSGVEYAEVTRVELLQTVLDEIDRLDRVVANLLAASRIEAGAMVPRPAALAIAELVTDRLRALGPLVREHDVVVDVPEDLPEVEADYGQLEQVVTNLLANAVRYSPPRTTITVEARHESEHPTVSVGVLDEGPGIPAEITDRIFEPFVHGVGSRSTGLGLSICKAILNAHGGLIEVESRSTGGAAVWFTLPVAQTIDSHRVAPDGS